MSIIYNNKTKTFTLNTKNTSYQMKIGNLNYLKHLYYGPSIEDEDLSYQIKRYDRGFSGNVYDSLDVRVFSLDAQPQEFSTLQQGDFRVPSIEVINADKSYSFDGRFKSYKIYKGKYEITGMPSSFAREDESVETLEIVLEDVVSKLEVTLKYSVFEEADIITRCSMLTNKGQGDVHVRKLMSTCLDFMNGSGKDMFYLPGRYGQERQVERLPIKRQIHTIASGRGSSSHQQNPFLTICDHDTTEDYGACYGFALVYSGNHKTEVELDQYDQLRIVMGISDKNFDWLLKGGESFETPEVIHTFTEKGLTGMSHLYHDFFRRNMNRSRFVSEERPILINSWEAVFMDFDDKKLVEIAKAAKKMGVEMLVMDDGWFGKRDDDNSGLGDWYVNENKIKCGLHKLVEQINDLDMKFGIWFEPEMVSEDSDLYRAHPEWVMEIPGRKAVRSRNQLALDMANKEVQDYLIKSVNAILDDANIAYLKWDINRSVTDIWANSLPADRQGEVYHRYVLGLYRVMDGIIKTHPDVLFEGCSGGGGRYDPAMLCYYPQYWMSDNTKPLDDLKLHYGTSFLYPITSMGTHVSDASPFVPFDTKAVIAMCGTFGYELDATHLSDDVLAACREKSAIYKKHYHLFAEGDYYRLTNPFEIGNFTGWQSVSKDQKEALVSVVTTNTTMNGPQEYLKLKGLLPQQKYTVDDLNGNVLTLTGNALMKAGLPIDREQPDFTSFQFEIKAI